MCSHTHTYTQSQAALPLLSASFRNRHNGAANKKRKLLPQAHFLLPFIVLHKGRLLIQRGRREERREEKREARKASQSSFEFHLIFLWELRCGGGGKEKKINYGAHLNIIWSSQPPTRRPSPRKPNYSANLSLAVAGLVLKKTIKRAWINLWQPPYL